jgi:hypothetical protein
MDLQKNRAACIAVILTCCSWTAQAAQPNLYSNRDGCCPKGVDCIPKRGTYGFTPTRWRTWPAAEKPPAMQSGSESSPTPAKELPKVESEAPQSPAEEAPLRPTETETESALPQTPGGLPPAGLFEDTPPSPPKESDGEGEPPNEQPESADGLPSVPPQIQLPAPEDADKPPAMEDEDPFKDDPIPHRESPAAEPPARGATKTNPAKNSISISDRRRVDNKSQVNLADSSPTPRAAAPGEPGLLRVDYDQHAGRGLLPIKTPDMRNPLRPETVKHRENKIVPTADWSADPVAASDEADSHRSDHDGQGARGLLPITTRGMRNPLRSEIAKHHEDQVVPASDAAADQVGSNDTSVAWRRNPLRAN